jgi:hypothetical protein
LFAIQGFGNKTRYRSLPDTPRAAEDIRVRYPLMKNGILKRPCNDFLPDNVIESLGPVFFG